MSAVPIPDQPTGGTHAGGLPAGAGSPASPKRNAYARSSAAAGDFLTLRIWAESFEDAQRARVSSGNRMLRGGVDPDPFLPTFEMQKAAEHALALALRRSYRRVVRAHCPGVEEWAKAHAGLGEHLLARLLGVVGHPRHAQPYRWMEIPPPEHECAGRCGESRHLVALEPYERTVRELWSWCGHGDPARKRRKGMSADEAAALGNPRAKTLTHLLAECAMKCRPKAHWVVVGRDTNGWGGALPDPAQRGGARREVPGGVRFYRRVYDEARVKYAERDWTLGHQYNAALRKVGKEILRGLWAASA